ncbi:hypothetical protein BH92_02060 [Rhodococcoides fascians A21d2]|uniref:hypothetical protein n=1 Tax=Nocardiaceae TaxID=85025 RepID=UPI00055FC908|nr:MULTISPECIES: hypothetical protein [Rhodococcus]OZE82698.1 hypothetical protein CH305_09170 [Rhodococcus sp. 15-649-2-2]QIH98805.1 hypothetical protein BH92_02060 [Rhodococcus fascians A21d2]
MTVRPSDDATAADWLVHADRDWWDLVTRGPLGYESYARLRFIPDPEHPTQREGEADVPYDERSETDQLAIVVATLAKHTTTPLDCYFCVWEGWGVPTVRGAARINLPERGAFLFRGPALDLLNWEQALDPPGSESLPIPSFVWPSDRAWCIANDVDPHFATIGASSSAIEDVLADRRVDTVSDDPARPQPWYSH